MLSRGWYIFLDSGPGIYRENRYRLTVTHFEAALYFVLYSANLFVDWQLFQLDVDARAECVRNICRACAPGRTTPLKNSRTVPPPSDELSGVVIRIFGTVLVDEAVEHVPRLGGWCRVTRAIDLKINPDSEEMLAKIKLLWQRHAIGMRSPLTVDAPPGAHYKLPETVDGTVGTGISKWFPLTNELLADADRLRAVPPGVPFVLEKTEHEYVENWVEVPSPTLLLGRGGSGKTVVALRALRNVARRGNRALFVTDSSKLCTEAERQYYKGEPPPRAPFHRLADAWTPSSNDGPRFFTTHELLLAIDGSLANPFFHRNTDHALSDKHDVDREVTLSRCSRWFGNSKATPSVVLTEITTHIKGSYAVFQKRRFMTREEYCSLSSKDAPAFASTTRADVSKYLDRDGVYNEFERYEKERKKRGMWDRCDIALHAAQSLATGCGGSVVEFLDALVIDEVSYSSRGTATCKACPLATSL